MLDFKKFHQGVLDFCSDIHKNILLGSGVSHLEVRQVDWPIEHSNTVDHATNEYFWHCRQVPSPAGKGNHHLDTVWIG